MPLTPSQLNELNELIEPWREAHRRDAWRPVTEDRDVAAAGSYFGGVALTSSDHPWPICPGCERPMTHFVQLDLASLPAGSRLHAPSGLLQLFYCTNDGCIESEGAYEAFSKGSVVRIIESSSVADAPAAPGAAAVGAEIYPARVITRWERFDDLPSASEHEELGLRYDYDFQIPPGEGSSLVTWADHFTFGPVPAHAGLAEAISTAREGDKLGGWPNWMQNVEYPACPRCGSRMQHVLQIDSEDHVPYMFGDVGCGHVTRCPNHPDVLAFAWACG